MPEKTKKYEVKGKGFETLRELCNELRSKLNAGGFNLTSDINISSLDGMTATNNKATGLLYLVDSQNNGVEIDVTSDASSVEEGKSLLDYYFSKANVRAYGNVNAINLESAMSELLYEKIMKVYFHEGGKRK